MKDRIKIFFGMKGTWKWAMKQMLNGHIISYDAWDTIYYKTDEHERMLLSHDKREWKNAIMIFSYFYRTSWEIVNEMD